MTSFNRWLVITLLAALSGAAFSSALAAQESEATEETKPVATDDSKQPDAEKKTTPSKPSADVFVPSEDISEDFAVSFPVDI